ncbi:MAG: hypothetical protein R2811_05630 [Flavobacteriales bacterium]
MVKKPRPTTDAPARQRQLAEGTASAVACSEEATNGSHRSAAAAGWTEATTADSPQAAIASLRCDDQHRLQRQRAPAAGDGQTY